MVRGTASTSSGGAVFCSASASSGSDKPPTLEIFDAPPSGGAAACYPYFGNASDPNATVRHACAHNGVYFGPGALVHRSTSAYGGGGAIGALLCDVTLAGSTLADNVAEGAASNGGGVLLRSASRLTTLGNTSFLRNRAARGSGGAYACDNCGGVALSNTTTLTANTAALQSPACPRPLNSFFATQNGPRGPACSCPAGSYSQVEGASVLACRTCPTQATSPAGSTSLDNCSCNGFDRYFPQISPAGDMTCAQCPPDAYLVPGGSGSAETACRCDGHFYRRTSSAGLMSCAALKTCADAAVYVDDHDFANPAAWRCADCPRGGSCAGNVNVTGVVPLFGYGRCPAAGRGGAASSAPTFEACSFAAACLGAPNRMLAGKFMSAEEDGGIDLATQHHNESCGNGYRQDGLLCSACAEGYALAGLRSQCDRCPEEGANVAVAVLGILAGFLGLVAYVRVTLSDAGSLDDSDGAKSIGLSYVQVLSLLITFPIAWPTVFIALFQVCGAVTVLGTHLVNVKCLFPALTEAEVFYTTRCVWALLPLVLSAACALCWCAARKKSPKTWTRKMRASVVALLYLVWPGLCSEVFALFACRSTCGASRLLADLNELCFEGRHAAFALGLGLPMLVLYVVGLPAAALFMVYRIHRRAAMRGKPMSDLKGHLTFGLFYSAFRKEVWWWEATVAARKIGIAAIGVFGTAMLNMQVHVTLLLVAANFVLTVQTQPFGTKNGLQRLEYGVLVCTFLTLWAGSVFNSHPRCEVEGGKQGDTLGWCDFLSVAIGLANVVAVVVTVLYFLHLKGLCTCLAECFGKIRVAGKGLAKTASAKLMRKASRSGGRLTKQSSLHLRKRGAPGGAEKTPNFYLQQAAVRQRTVDAADTTNVGNPVADLSKAREIELQDMSGVAAKTATQRGGGVAGRAVPLQRMHRNPQGARRGGEEKQKKTAREGGHGGSGGGRSSSSSSSSSRATYSL